MKSKTLLTAVGAALMCAPAVPSAAMPLTLRANQIGYKTDDIKAVVYMGDIDPARIDFRLIDLDGAVRAADSVRVCEPWAPARYSARVYVSSATAPGNYILEALSGDGDTVSVRVFVGHNPYRALAPMPLGYIRQQRCGYNPVHKARCHEHDGFKVLSGADDGRHVDVTGGWHDASDYLQYLTTSANSVYMMLAAYRANPGLWGDSHDALGRRGSNGVPDILDEARWGLEWMMRMNPSDTLYFNQIADDRDHRYVGVPQRDSTDYGMGAGKGRPVYPCSGQPYGLKGNLNRSRGKASSVAKFASAFALGSEVWASRDSTLSQELGRRAARAFEYAAANEGACQTAPCVSPYFYEEDNWVDDMELAAVACARIADSVALKRRLLSRAVDYGRREPVTPWMGADSARHYQWYPFVNLGHPAIIEADGVASRVKDEFVRHMRDGVRRVAERGAANVFMNGIPFVWCSNNLSVSYVTQAMIYRMLTGDDAWRESETAVRDWLFGVNPWGQVMMILPQDGIVESPRDPHSAMTDMIVGGRPGRDWLIGGLVDGPVYSTIFDSLWGVHLRNDDRFAAYQGGECVYHDDFSDYSTNEPTLDGTASLTLLLGLLSR